MKIGLVRRGYSGTGGAEAYLKRFAREATSLGHECILFATRDWPKAEWSHARRNIAHGRSPLEFALELITANPKRDCDVLFSLDRVLGCDCYRAGDGVHSEWLQRRARYEPGWKSWWRNRQEKHHELVRLEETLFKGEAARAVIANSRMVKEEIIRHFGYPAERIHVVYNGAPPALSLEESARARAEVRAELGLDPNEYVLIFVGSGWERKGLRYAVEAMNDPALERATLLVAGSGKPRRMPRSKRVRYLGATRGTGRYLAAADAFVLPTLYEPFSNACLEAMAAGLPVITTQANGFAEILERGVNGEVLSEPSDVLALVRAIERWADPVRRAGVQEALRAKGTLFSMEANVRETLAILQELSPPLTAGLLEL